MRGTSGRPCSRCYRIARPAPGEQRDMWPDPAQLRHNIGVQEIHRRQANAPDLGRRLPPRFGSLMSARGPSASSRSFSAGLAIRCSCCQSRTGTSTAASVPRRVTSCGPSLRQVSSSSLNRAFASWTDQLFTQASRLSPSQITSHLPSRWRDTGLSATSTFPAIIPGLEYVPQFSPGGPGSISSPSCRCRRGRDRCARHAAGDF
jgi:hypothetical protein